LSKAEICIPNISIDTVIFRQSGVLSKLLNRFFLLASEHVHVPLFPKVLVDVGRVVDLGSKIKHVLDNLR
jgi:hypothetical protein